MHRNTHSPAISSMKWLPFLPASLQNKNKLCHPQLQHILVQPVFSQLCTQSLEMGLSPLHQSPPEADSQTWQNTRAPNTKNLYKPPSTTLTYLGMAAEQGLGHSGSTTLALLPSGPCWSRSWGGARQLPLLHTQSFWEQQGTSSSTSSTDSEIPSHLHGC